MAITKKDANAKYDKLRKQLKIGEIDKETFKRSANAIYKKYHSKANTATRNAPKSKPKASKPQQSKPKASNTPPPTSTAKPSTPQSKAARMPSNPPSPTVMKKGSKTGAAVDPRERSLLRNRQEAQRQKLKAGAREVSQAARRQNPNPSSMAMGPAKNPKKGHTYKKPFGRVMVFNGTKYVPK